MQLTFHALSGRWNVGSIPVTCPFNTVVNEWLEHAWGGSLKVTAWRPTTLMVELDDDNASRQCLVIQLAQLLFCFRSEDHVTFPATDALPSRSVLVQCRSRLAVSVTVLPFALLLQALALTYDHPFYCERYDPRRSPTSIWLQHGFLLWLQLEWPLDLL